MFELSIQSYKGEYSLQSYPDIDSIFTKLVDHKDSYFYIIDEKVAELNTKQIERLGSDCLFLTANEPNKSLNKMPEYATKLVDKGLKRDKTLVAIGGGITQDITCFLASILFRGIDWLYVPTTLLAQADSCIGSKSSINVGDVKNLVGNFYPPKNIFLTTAFLKTLEQKDIRSGIGEIIKVHIIDGPNSFASLAREFADLENDENKLLHFIIRSLEIKKRLIELDEFDTKERRVMNYGHSFGHAIESATNYAIPHGVAVSIGMDMANSLSLQKKLISQSYFNEMHKVLQQNYIDFVKEDISIDKFVNAISKDKKNTGSKLTLIIPNENAIPHVYQQEKGDFFTNFCQNFFDKMRA